MIGLLTLPPFSARTSPIQRSVGLVGVPGDHDVGLRAGEVGPQLVLGPLRA